MREEQIKILEQMRDAQLGTSTISGLHPDTRLGCKLRSDALTDAISYIRDTSEKWIPVSERLPMKDGKYLVTVHNTRISATHPELEYTVQERSVRDGDFMGAEYSHIRLIAWRPLPDPHKEKR
jgi:hypothetical protein